MPKKKRTTKKAAKTKQPDQQVLVSTFVQMKCLSKRKKRQKKTKSCAVNTDPKLSLISKCLERSTRPQIACGPSLQESLESLEHKVQWAAAAERRLRFLSPCQIHGSLLRQSLRELFPKVQEFDNVCHAVRLVHLLPKLCGTSAKKKKHRCIEAVLALALLIPFLSKRKMCATRHLDFLIRLAVLSARLQFRESTLGPLRPERSFRCPAFTPTVASQCEATNCWIDNHSS